MCRLVSKMCAQVLLVFKLAIVLRFLALTLRLINSLRRRASSVWGKNTTPPPDKIQFPLQMAAEQFSRFIETAARISWEGDLDKLEQYCKCQAPVLQAQISDWQAFQNILCYTKKRFCLSLRWFWSALSLKSCITSVLQEEKTPFQSSCDASPAKARLKWALVFLTCLFLHWFPVMGKGGGGGCDPFLYQDESRVPAYKTSLILFWRQLLPDFCFTSSFAEPSTSPWYHSTITSKKNCLIPVMVWSSPQARYGRRNQSKLPVVKGV